MFAHGYEIDYITISEDSRYAINNAIIIDGKQHDHYFATPYLLQESKEYVSLINDHSFLMVEWGSIAKTKEMKLLFDQRPRLYTNTK